MNIKTKTSPSRLTPSLVKTSLGVLAVTLISQITSHAQINTVAELVDAVNNGATNSTVIVEAGTYNLTAPLAPKAGMTIKGAGIGQTIIQGASSWVPSTSTLPDPEITTTGLDSYAYLFRLGYGLTNITISDMTLKGPQLHGAIFANDNDNLTLERISVVDFLWSGFRLFRIDGGNIHDCDFTDAGGRWSNGSPGTTGGINGGAIFATFMGTTDIWNNRFTRTQTAPEDEFYGVKGRKFIGTRIYNNTINVNFSIELPFENDENVEIDHNICKGVISIPKSGGGAVPASGTSFRVHHNYFTTSYAIEGVRNGVEIDHNLFDYKTTSDYGNLMSCFGTTAAQGPLKFHNNLVKNPGRGVFWSESVYNNIQFYNNHVIANTTTTPRTDGLFGFNTGNTMNTTVIKDNIIECIGQTRPLVRNTASYSAVIQNNTLTNVSGTSNYVNANTGAVRGLTSPLLFNCGVNNESIVNGWFFGPSSILATADSYTRDGSYASTNYGRATGLVTKSTSSSGFSRRSFMKFPVASLAGSPTANLILHVENLGTEGASGFTAELRQIITDTWTETGLTWNNQPASGTLINSFTVLPSDVGNEISIDVSGFIAQQAIGDGTASFVLMQPGNANRTINFSSREGSMAPRIESNP